MNEKNPTPDDADLRARAEARLKDGQAEPVSETVKSLADSQRLVHELQVHQIELELQNAELLESRDELELLLDKYTDLYNFAPIGYFSLDIRGRIQEVNLKGSVLLGAERSTLINRPLSSFVKRSSRGTFLEFLENLFVSSGTTACEVRLAKSDGSVFWASLHGGGGAAQRDAGDSIRVALSDITSLKRAQETQHQMEVLSATNLELNEEIVKRQASEKALRKSERRKGVLLKESHHLQSQLRDFSRRIIETREEERRLISRELHDEITQLLVGINIRLETLARGAAMEPAVLREKIARTQSAVEDAVKSIHDFARNLRPTSLEDLGLIATIESYVEEFAERTGIRVSFESFPDVEKMSCSKRTTIYRIVLEALINVDKHAKAEQVEVSIRKSDDLVRLEISDDGKSFDIARTQAEKGSQHLGLIGIREQAEMVGGELAIQSAPGQGTKITVTLPFKDAAG